MNELTTQEMMSITGGDLSWSNVIGGAIGGLIGFAIGGPVGAAIGGAYAGGIAAAVIEEMSQTVTPGIDNRYPPIITS